MTREEIRFNEIGHSFDRAESGKLFGKPCYKIGGKAFLCFFQSCAVFKLPEGAREDALAKPGTQLFDPSGKGRPMKEWVQLPYEYEPVWNRFAQAALQFVEESTA